MNRRHFLAGAACAAAPPSVALSREPAADEAAIREVIRRYVDAREASDPEAIKPLFTPDADQLVSDGTWRKGRDELVKGMLESSKRNPAKRAIAVESVRLIAPDVALADGRYTQKARDGGKDRELWAAFALRREVDGWRIAAIRNMLPAQGG